MLNKLIRVAEQQSTQRPPAQQPRQQCSNSKRPTQRRHRQDTRSETLSQDTEEKSKARTALVPNPTTAAHRNKVPPPPVCHRSGSGSCQRPLGQAPHPESVGHDDPRTLDRQLHATQQRDTVPILRLKNLPPSSPLFPPSLPPSSSSTARSPEQDSVRLGAHVDAVDRHRESIRWLQKPPSITKRNPLTFQLLEGVSDARRGAGFLCQLAGIEQRRHIGKLTNFTLLDVVLSVECPRLLLFGGTQLCNVPLPNRCSQKL